MDDRNLHVFVFYCGSLSRSAAYASDVLAHLEAENIPVASVDVDHDDVEWKKLDLRSVPAIVFYFGDFPMSNIVSYASVDAISARLLELRDRDTSGQTHGLQDLHFHVAASSGTHRYSRWHEDFLCTANEECGWCAPMMLGGSAHLVLSLLKPSTVHQIQLYPRRRTDGTASFKSFPKGIEVFSGQGVQAQKVWSNHNIEPIQGSEPYIIKLEKQVDCTTIVVKVTHAHDIDGKQFPSLRRVRLLGRCDANAKSLPPVKKGNLRKEFNRQTLVKHGLFASEESQLEQFNFCRGQYLPASIGKFDRVFYVVSGALHATCGGVTNELVALDALVIQANELFEVSATSDSIAIMLHTRTDLDMIWESRASNDGGYRLDLRAMAPAESADFCS